MDTVVLPSVHNGQCDWPGCAEPASHALIAHAYLMDERGAPVATDLTPTLDDMRIEDFRLETRSLVVEVGYLCPAHVDDAPQSDAELVSRLPGEGTFHGPQRGTVAALARAYPHPLPVSRP